MVFPYRFFPWTTTSHRLPVRILFVYLLYILGDTISICFSFPNRVAVFWIPNGITMAILIRSHYKSWFPYLIASFLAYFSIVYFTDQYTISQIFSLGMGNCIEIGIGAWLFRFFTPQPIVLSDIKTMLHLIFLSGICGTAIGALFGAAVVVKIFGHHDYFQVWSIWFAGDGIGTLLILPCILAWTSSDTKTYSLRQRVEIGLHFLFCITASILIFSNLFSSVYAFTYFMFPLLLWAGLRFDLRITTLSLIVFCMVSSWFTNTGQGPFALHSQSLTPGVFTFQIFFGITIFTVLVVSTIIQERKRIEMEKEALIHSLENAIHQIKTLSGLLPICSHCKKIRDEQGTWKALEEYIPMHSDAQFSHGICPECTKIHYPTYFSKIS